MFIPIEIFLGFGFGCFVAFVVGGLFHVIEKHWYGDDGHED